MAEEGAKEREEYKELIKKLVAKKNKNTKEIEN